MQKWQGAQLYGDYVGGAVVLVNIKMELKKINHCVTISKSAMWIIEKGSWQRWLSVSLVAIATNSGILRLKFPRTMTSRNMFEYNT